MTEQQEHAANLKKSRSGSLKNSINTAKKKLDAAKDSISLMSYADPLKDWMFGIALIFAILKDILDLIDNALVAAAGLGAILTFIFTLLASFIIGFVMLLTGSSSKNKVARTILKRFAILAGTTLIEFIPGIDLLPLESITVVVIVWMTLVERKVDAEEDKKKKDEPQPQTA